MRILTRRIYRAFPELDRYSDEQCERFVRAARRGVIRRAVHWLAIVFVGLCVLRLGAIPVAYLGNALDRSGYLDSHGPLAFSLWISAIAIPCMGIAPVSAFLMRDWLLRRRVRFILRARGVCMNCRYSLVGLPVGERYVIACPECATECHVDPSLGELVADDAGALRYQPSPGSLPKPLFFTPGRVRIVRRVGWVAAALLFFGVPLLWGGYEAWLHYQAAIARAAIPGNQAISALVEKNQPPGTTPDDPNAFDALAQAVLIMEAADSRVWRVPNPGISRPLYPDFGGLYQDGSRPRSHSSAWTQADQDHAQACIDLARRMLDVYRADVLLDKLDEVASLKRAVRPMASGPLVLTPPKDHRALRALGRLSAARIQLAWEASDLPEFTRSLRAGLSIARVLSYQAEPLDRLTGTAIESLLLGRLRAVLAAHPTAGWLDAIGAVFHEQAGARGVAVMLEGMRLSSQARIAAFFSDPSNARLGRWSPALARQSRNGVTGRLGSYAENAARVDAVYAAAQAFARLAPHARDLATISVGDTRLALADPLLSEVITDLVQLDARSELDRQSLPVLIALEQFRFTMRTYPQSLDELRPAYLPQTPTDPFSGRPFGYRRLPKPDEQGREFLLYSTGVDKTDDGGKARPGNAAQPLLSLPLRSESAGVDFILNDRDRW